MRINNSKTLLRRVIRLIGFIENLKKREINEALASHGDYIKGLQDLTAGIDPSWIFYLVAKRYGRALCGETEESQLLREINFRRRLNPLIKSLAGLFMEHKQVFENCNTLCVSAHEAIATDSVSKLPKEPVVWIANHAFKDDIAATILAAKRHAYVLFGSLPQLYNSFDGLALYLNGIVLMNRKASASKRLSTKKAVEIIKSGTDLIIFPEGVWNKTPEKLVLDFWPGVYRISQETGAKIVPMAHYIKDPVNRARDNPIHTVVDEPIGLENMAERSALIYLRDIVATWYYLMMEKYGRSTRDEEMKAEASVHDIWGSSLRDRVKTAGRYDTEIEFSADYRSKEIITPEQVWQAVASIQMTDSLKVAHVMYAKRIIVQRQEDDYQHRF